MLSAPPKDGPDGRLQLHASTIVFDGKAVAFVGPSGIGKSSHALACLTRNAQLLADDVTWLKASESGLIAECPPNIQGRIEARGVGLVKATIAPPTPLHLIVDLGTVETARLPDRKTIALLGHDIALFHRFESVHFLDAILHYVVHGWAE